MFLVEKGNCYVFSNVYEVFELTVIAATVPVDSVRVTAIGSPTQLNSGEKLQLTATVYPSDATNKAVTWTVVSGNAANVSTGGLVTGAGAGQVTIRATSKADDSKYDDYVLTILATSGPGTVTGNSGFTYATYCYPNHVGCWTENIKEAGQSTKTHSTHGEGERGYYYVWANAANACAQVPDYSLPNADQWNTLKSYLSSATAAAEKNFFYSGSALAGDYNINNSTWYNWGSNGLWWSSSASSQYFYSSSTSLVGPTTNSNSYYFSVRCVKSN